MKETLQALKQNTTSTMVKRTELQLLREVKSLIKESKELTKEVRNLKKLEFVQVLKKPWKFLLLSLGKGVMVGFGSVLGASLVVALFFYLIAQISLVPILGDFVSNIMSYVDIPQTSQQPQQPQQPQQNNNVTNK